MKNLGSLTAICAALLFVSLCVGLMTAGPVIAQGGQTTPFQNVVVTNTSAQPVPTTIQGTIQTQGSVSIDPTGNIVKAAQQGTWNVGITGTPTVSATPPPTRPFRVRLTNTTTSGPTDWYYSNTSSDLLVIDFITTLRPAAYADVPVILGVGSSSTSTPSQEYRFMGNTAPASYGPSVSVASEMTKIFVLPGETVTARFPVTAELSGHFEPYVP